MGLLAYAVAVFCTGVIFVVAPSVVRARLMPNWSSQGRGVFSGASLLSFRIAGVCFILIGALSAAGFFFGKP